MMKNGRSRPRTAWACLLSAGTILAFAGVAGAAEGPGVPTTQEVRKLIDDLGAADIETAKRAAINLGASGDAAAVPALLCVAVGDVAPDLPKGATSKLKVTTFDDQAYAKAKTEAAAAAGSALTPEGAREVFVASPEKIEPKNFNRVETIEVEWGNFNGFAIASFRAAAIDSLGRLRSAEALAPLTAIYSREKDPRILTAAAEAIVRIDQDAGYELLAKDLGGKDVSRITSAISGLALVGNREVMPELAPLLYDEATKVDVRRAMGKRPYQETRDHVLKMLADRDVAVVTDALYILRAQAKAGAIPAPPDDAELGETLAALGGDTRYPSWAIAMGIMSEIGLHEELREIICACLESRVESEQVEALTLLLTAIDRKRIDTAYLDDRMIDSLRRLREGGDSPSGRRAFQLLSLARLGAE